MTKKQKVLEMQKYFREKYGAAACSLDYQEPYELIISTILAAQCTDARVNIVTKDLFRKYPTCQAFADADLAELEQDIKSTGFYHNKAKGIKGTCQILMEKYGGEVPDTMEELLELPGVGRKIANLILGDVFGKPCIVVDTHCKRITGLVGLTDQTDPAKIEVDLRKIVPPEYGSEFCHQLVWFGRDTCIARRPQCANCGISHLCRHFSGTAEGRAAKKA